MLLFTYTVVINIKFEYYCTTVIVQINVDRLTTHLGHSGGAVLTLMNVEKTSKDSDDRSNSSLGSLCERSKMKNVLTL